MKKNSTGEQRGKRTSTEMHTSKLQALQEAHRRGQVIETKLTVGLDLGDRASCYCILDEQGEVIGRGTVVNEKQPLAVLFMGLPASVVALEVGTHSPWMSRMLKSMGHEVIVANARQVKLISESSRKSDRLDAEFLARLARADRKLLAPIRHREEEGQADLMGVRVRARLVELRTETINAARGFVKSFGQRLAQCDADNLNREHARDLEPAIRPHVERLLRMVETLSEEIKRCDEELKRMGQERYREETERLEQVQGVGTITALTFVLTLEDASRFERSRDVGCYVGLRPKSKQSSESDPEMHISKEGDVYLRKLLVQCAQYILSRRGADTDLKRWGQQIASKGKKKAKKRAVVAVARKLAVLLHRLWVSGERYEPLRHSKGAAGKAA